MDMVFTEKNLGLGFTRLSIIDLQNGMQPIESMSKRYVIICFPKENQRKDA